jgi:hypothetical protein
MALNTNELYSRTTKSPEPRIQPAAGPGAVAVKQFFGGTAETLEPGTPVYVNGSGLVGKTVPAGTAHGSVTDTHAESVYGFVWPTAVVTAASGEVHGTIMLRGSIHLDDIEALRAAGKIASTNAHLLLVLRHPNLRKRGLHIDGLTLAN